MTMRCQDFLEHLDDFRRGGPDPTTRAAVERHLAGCDVCRATLDEAEALGALLRQSAPGSRTMDAQYFDKMRGRVFERIIAEPPARVKASAIAAVPRWRRASWWLEVAAVFAFGVLAANLYHQAGSETPLPLPKRDRAIARGLATVAVGDKADSPPTEQAVPEAASKPAQRADQPAPAAPAMLEAQGTPPAPAPTAAPTGSLPAVDQVAAKRDASLEQQLPARDVSNDAAARKPESAMAAAAKGSAGELKSARLEETRTRRTQTAEVGAQKGQAVAGAPGSPALASDAMVPAAAPASLPVYGISQPAATPPPTEPGSRAFFEAAPAARMSGPATSTATDNETRATSDAVRLYMSAEDAQFRGQHVGAIALFESAIEAAGASPLAVQAHLRIADIAAGTLNDPVRARIAYEACLAPSLGAHVTPETSATIAARLGALR